MTSFSASRACCARRVSIRPSGRSSWKKFRRRSFRARVGTAVSGIATDKMGLSMPNLVTAAGSGRKSKVRHVPVSAPTLVPYSSTTRSAMAFPRHNRRAQLHARLAHSREEAVHRDGWFPGFELPDVLLCGPQPLGELALSEARKQPGLLQNASERLGTGDSPRIRHNSSDCHIGVRLLDYDIGVK